jgi:hypothetical protein
MPMTDDQWNAIVRYVLAELETKQELDLVMVDLVDDFGLTLPFYAEMVQRAKNSDPGFCIEVSSGWRFDPSQDPVDIRFRRAD